MIKEFRLPDVGEGLTEADIVSWHVKPGDTVEVNQVIVEIETAKAVVELPCPWDGIVSRLLVDEAQTVDVGTPIIAVEVAGTTPDGANGSSAPVKGAGEAGGGTDEPAATSEPAPTGERRGPAVLVGYGVREASTKRRPRATTAPPVTVPAPAVPEPQESLAPSAPSIGGNGANDRRGDAAGTTRALAKPPVRKLARDLGIDLTTVQGTGPEGSITRDDLKRANEAPKPSRVSVAVGDERIPVRGVRKHTAAAMVSSAFTAPHVTEFLQVDVTEMMAAVRRVREMPDFADVKVSPLLFVARALLVAAARYPMINSTWDEAAQEIVVRGQVNLGIAAATERGLIVPNVKDAGRMTLVELAHALDSLAKTAREGKASPADLTGGSITITNVGVFGVDAGTPILTPGEAAILAFGQVREMPWVHEGQLAIRRVTTLSLSFDHRIVDGELGSAVLRDVGSMLEDPLRMLAWS
jgi:2-oxoisovalerate dehydrogenase E2 component (dihydrolipoyl transacylase)